MRVDEAMIDRALAASRPADPERPGSREWMREILLAALTTPDARSATANEIADFLRDRNPGIGYNILVCIVVQLGQAGLLTPAIRALPRETNPLPPVDELI